MGFITALEDKLKLAADAFLDFITVFEDEVELATDAFLHFRIAFEDELGLAEDAFLDFIGPGVFLAVPSTLRGGTVLMLERTA